MDDALSARAYTGGGGDPGPLDLIDEAEAATAHAAPGKPGARARTRRGATTNRLLALGILLVLAVAAIIVVVQDAGVLRGVFEPPARQVARARLAAAPPVEAVIYDTRNREIAPESAIELNASRAPDIRHVVPARAFLATAAAAQVSAAGHQAALECLAQAVYYEAASESEDGQRAVAQVVLNRVRSPAFPNTVCGVVFQGWTRSTGCQFSFTCDGSMQRPPSAGGLARARRIAAEALDGAVMRAVGNATHYHANYVVPYWASSLDKVKTVGRHIFYLMRGGLGRPSAFNARYASALEQSPFASLEGASLAVAGPMLAGMEDAGAASATLRDPLAADLAMGQLITAAPIGVSGRGEGAGVSSGGAVLAPPGAAGGSATAHAPGKAQGRSTALHADGAGHVEPARGGSLIADERHGTLNGEQPAPQGPQTER